MCGIAGGLFWNGRIDPEAARVAVSAMVGALGHRGPDGRGLFTSAPAPSSRAPFVVLGHTRLAIIDVSEAGAQPMAAGNAGPCITFNGEIYNHDALRAELMNAGERFRSRSDTEAILLGYRRWGLDVVPRLRGMFAFGIWDPQAERLTLVRDRFGIKPLYVHRGDSFVLFSSEIRALLASGLVPRRLDATGLWQYLAYQTVPAPRTIVDGISMLAPASWMCVSGSGAVDERTYWHMLDGAAHTADVGADEAPRLVRDRLLDSVSAHLVSDVPVGAFLSGGIDSSAVVALMRECGIQPRTFSVGFEEAPYDESAHAAAMATACGADHTEIRLRPDDLLDQLPTALDSLDHPTGDAINTWVVSGAVRAQGIKVALSGLGGDEIFGGYPSFARLLRVADVARIWGRSPQRLRRMAASAVRTAGRQSIASAKAAALLESDGDVASMWPPTRQVLSAEQRDELAADGFRRRVDDTADPYERLLSNAFEDAPASSIFSRISFAEARAYMHDVLLRDTDQTSMAHGLEVRVPLLDHELVELVVSLPDAVKQSNGTPKRLLVDAMGPRLPSSIVHRPKQGFSLPFEPWMRGPLRTFCEDRLGDRGISGRGLLEPKATMALWRSFLGGGRNVTWSRLWLLVALEAWLDRNGIA